MFRWIYMPKRRSRKCCCSSVIDGSESFPGSSPAEAFPIEAYSAAAARPPVNSLLFIVLAFLAHPIADRKAILVKQIRGLEISWAFARAAVAEAKIPDGRDCPAGLQTVRQAAPQGVDL